MYWARLYGPDRRTAKLRIGLLSATQPDLFALGIAALALPCASAALFAAGLAKARNDGGLSRWT